MNVTSKKQLERWGWRGGSPLKHLLLFWRTQAPPSPGDLRLPVTPDPGDATALAPALTCTCTRPHVWQSGQRGVRAKVRTHVSVPSPVDGDSRTQVAVPLHRPLWGPRWLQGSFLSIQFPAEGSDSQRAMAKCSRSSAVKGWVAED